MIKPLPKEGKFSSEIEELIFRMLSRKPEDRPGASEICQSEQVLAYFEKKKKEK